MAGLDKLREQLAKLGREDLITIAQATAALEKQDQKLKLQEYTPNGVCEGVINAFGQDDTFITLFNAGNGVGKSALGVNIVANIIYGPQSKWFLQPIFKNWPYLTQGRIVSDPTTIEEKIVPELQKWLPAGTYSATKNGKKYLSHWVINTGFTFDLMTYEQDAKEFESVDLGFVWFDEPPPRAIYLACVSRARRGMVIFWTQTPLRAAAWVNDDIVAEADKETAQEIKQRGQRYFTGHVEDNCKIHGTRGILEHEHILKMVNKYPEEEREARVSGKFGHLVGRVHKMFDQAIHVIKPFGLKPKDYATYQFLDPHPRTPDAVVWVAVDHDNQYYQVAELWMKGAAAELAGAIKEVEKQLNLRIEGRWIDPSAYVEDQHLQNSLAHELEQYGLHFNPGSKDLDEGIRLTNEALAYTKSGGATLLAPKLFVFNTCTRTIWEFHNYIWEEWRGTSSQLRNPKASPVDANDHMMENIHRAMLANLTFVPMVRHQGKTAEVSNSDLDPYN